MISVRYRRALAVAAVVVFFTNLAQYLFSADIVPVPPLYWIAGFGLAAAPLALSRDGLVSVARSPVVHWSLAFLAVTCLWLVFQTTDVSGGYKELNARVLTAVSLVSFVAVFTTADAVRWARWAVFYATALALAIDVYELFNPRTFSEVTGRSAGLYVNPNQAAAALLVGLVATIGLIPERFRLVWTGAVGAGVFVTFSRSAAVGWVLVVALAAGLRVLPVGRRALVGCAALALAAALVALQWDALTDALDDAGVLNRNVMSRVAAASGGDVASDDSAEARFDVARHAWRMFEDSPLVGNGVAASLDWEMEVSSHNQYLNMMVDHGALGVLILPALALAVLRRSRGATRRASLLFAAYVLFAGFFSHNVLSERYYLVAFALFGAMAATSRAAEPEPEPALAFDLVPEAA